MVSRVLLDHCSTDVLLASEQGNFPAGLWAHLTEAGLTHALIETGEHSLDVSPADAFEVVRLVGQHAAPVPLPETMLANWLLARCGLAPSAEPLVIVCDASLRTDGAGVLLTGIVEAVPWGRHAGVVACFERDGHLHVAQIGEDGVRVRAGTNVAREPRDRLYLSADLRLAQVARLPADLSLRHLRAAGAALRCNQIAGALRSVTEMTVNYACARTQFGRPIAKFQAVQQSIAVLASHAAASSAAADMAVDAFANKVELRAMAAAKIFAGEAATLCASLAHQVHGAMGMSLEYPLQFRTRRLWSWRDEYGNEFEWSAWLGSELSIDGADDLWSNITAIA